MNPNTFSLSVLLHKDGDAWVAQCLEVDLAAQGPSVDEAKSRFMKTLSAQIYMDLKESRPPFDGLGQAPKRYFDQSVRADRSGPELPVYVPVADATAPRVHASFLVSKAA